VTKCGAISDETVENNRFGLEIGECRAYSQCPVDQRAGSGAHRGRAARL